MVGVRDKNFKYIYIVKLKNKINYIIRIRGNFYGSYSELKLAILKRDEIVKEMCKNLDNKIYREKYIYHIGNWYYVRVNGLTYGQYTNIIDAITLRDSILIKLGTRCMPTISKYQLIRDNIFKRKEKYVKIYNDVNDYKNKKNEHNNISNNFKPNNFQLRSKYLTTEYINIKPKNYNSANYTEIYKLMFDKYINI